MKSLFKNLSLPLFIITIAISISGQAKLSAKSILNKVKKNTSSSYENVDLEMRIWKKGEKLERKLNIKKFDHKNQTKSLVKISSPQKLKGIGIYSEIKSGNEQQWLYLPSLRKSRRILKGNRKSSFLDSHLNFEDFSADMYQSYRSKIKSENKKTWVLESKPKSGDATYSKILTKVSKKTFLIQSVEYYNSKGKLEKSLAASKFKKFGKIWRATKLVVMMKNSKDKTQLSLTKLSTKKFPQNQVNKSRLEQ